MTKTHRSLPRVRSIHTASALRIAPALLAVGGLAGCEQDVHPVVVDERPAEIASTRPPPLSGGTLLVSHDDRHALVSDPDRDRLVYVDLETAEAKELALEKGDEPGRAIEDTAGRLHVALRGGNAIVTYNPVTDQLTRRVACVGPRGLAYEAATNRLHVGCVTGELLSFEAPAEGALVRSLVVPADVRDVVSTPRGLAITFFRSPHVLVLDADGEPTDDVVLGRFSIGGGPSRSPTVAWRTIVANDGAILIVNESAVDETVDLSTPEESDDAPPGEGDPYSSLMCEDVLVRAEISRLATNDKAFGVLRGATMAQISLPVDLGLSRSNARMAVVDAARARVVELTFDPGLMDALRCEDEDTSNPPVTVPSPVAVAYAGEDLWVLSREPSTLNLVREGQIERAIRLGGDSRADTGYELFHSEGGLTATGLACASCHPEGRDDGHVWTFVNIGERRTASLAGTVAGTAPYHWSGELTTFEALVAEVLTRRMGGPVEPAERAEALRSWVEGLAPVPSRRDDDDAIARGKLLFEDEQVGCASCHGGPRFTNNRTMSVGHGVPLQVPSLVGVAQRAPYMHDGCALTLMDRFNPACGGDQHGDLTGLTTEDLEDLVAYMTSL
ncbi:MAG: c-type cytochrome [Polyangiaceae bacterium]